MSYIGMNAAAKQSYGLDGNPPLSTTLTNFCHIFPPSTNWGFDSNDPIERKVSFYLFIICYLSFKFNVLQKKYSGNVWAIINSFRKINVLAELNGSKIHGLENGFTMNMELHSSFDNLRLWFEHIEVSG
jgi:hypothetical protein